MLAAERRRMIADLIRRQSTVRLKELSETLQASESTIRRDLEHLEQQGSCEVQGRRIVFGRVYLPDRPDNALSLVACRRAGDDQPLILLTTRVVETLDQALGVRRDYKQRWACEEAAQFLKSRVGLERFRVRCYEAIRRLAVLAMFAMGFLTWIVLRSRDLTKRLFVWTSRFRRQSVFLYYRLLDGLQEFVRQYPNALAKTPPHPP